LARDLYFWIRKLTQALDATDMAMSARYITTMTKATSFNRTPDGKASPAAVCKGGRVSFRFDQAGAEADRRAIEPAKPRAAKPASTIIQVDGSGTPTTICCVASGPGQFKGMSASA
jgi:hypothetical protein